MKYKRIKAMKIQNNEDDIDFIGDTHSNFIWTAGADVQKVWRKHGWQPPSEYRKDFLFPKNRGQSNDN